LFAFKQSIFADCTLLKVKYFQQKSALKFLISNIMMKMNRVDSFCSRFHPVFILHTKCLAFHSIVYNYRINLSLHYTFKWVV